MPAEEDDCHRAEHVHRVEADPDPHDQAKQHDDQHLGYRPDPGGKRLAGDERSPRRRRDQQLVEYPGIPLSNDLDPIKDRDEQRGLGNDPGR
jgi:hypothetical protein